MKQNHFIDIFSQLNWFQSSFRFFQLLPSKTSKEPISNRQDNIIFSFQFGWDLSSVLFFRQCGGISDSSSTGTCYTSSECMNRGGHADGHCASGILESKRPRTFHLMLISISLFCRLWSMLHSHVRNLTFDKCSIWPIFNYS